MAIAAARHGAPTAATCARGIIEKQTASWIGADSNARGRALRDKLGRRACDSREEPIESAFASDEVHAPFVSLLEEFIVAFGDPQDVINGLDPVAENGFFVEQGTEDFTKRIVEPLGFAQESTGTLGVVLR